MSETTPPDVEVTLGQEYKTIIAFKGVETKIGTDVPAGVYGDFGGSAFSPTQMAASAAAAAAFTEMQSTASGAAVFGSKARLRRIPYLDSPRRIEGVCLDSLGFCLPHKPFDVVRDAGRSAVAEALRLESEAIVLGEPVRTIERQDKDVAEIEIDADHRNPIRVTHVPSGTSFQVDDPDGTYDMTKTVVPDILQVLGAALASCALTVMALKGGVTEARAVVRVDRYAGAEHPLQVDIAVSGVDGDHQAEVRELAENCPVALSLRVRHQINVVFTES